MKERKPGDVTSESWDFYDGSLREPGAPDMYSPEGRASINAMIKRHKEEADRLIAQEKTKKPPKD
jgi:hypothetical protein